jgi:hypothetical protein
MLSPAEIIPSPVIGILIFTLVARAQEIDLTWTLLVLPFAKINVDELL